ncbi:phosphoadenylyl-sulfate reductase [Ferrovibrio sp.]|uniref:phosphoadenylyl-sulfate reductase n=1 Tax=Ferrovibrio sp. TaxID=1917215 RepID=UPI001B6D47C7|nr:phosphoadenylyl-sulfate reductase [Ferrovibrio sp.]MBP7065564.1 phosphoadenylyl-sulfate reductase [Ferrovibrio sp.]
MSSALALVDDELAEQAAELNRRFGGAPAESLLRTALTELFPGRITLVSSFGAEAAILLHLVAQIDAATPVLFIDTAKLFDHTLAYRDALVQRLGLSDLRILRPDPARLAALDEAGTLWFRDANACCAIRKVEPLQRGLSPFAAWINGRKRFQAGTRSRLPLVEAVDGRLKFNPLADWSAADLAAYAARFDLPAHPLVAEGYASIGCAPCTQPVLAGEDARAGRWRGQDKVECGIHTALPGSRISEE